MKIKYLLFLPLPVFFLSFFSCTKGDLPPVKIGVILPLSGDYKIYGTMGLNGIKMAVKDINESGGVLDGRKLELVIEDNQTDPGLSIRIARKFILTHNVSAIIGPVSSTARDAMLEVARELKTPLLYGIDYEGGSYDRYLFCFSAIPDHSINPVMPYLMKNYGNTVYIFGYDYVWPHKMAEAIQGSVKKNKGRITGIEFTPFGKKDFTPTLRKISGSGTKVLMLILPGPDGLRFIRQFNAAGMRKSTKIIAIASNETYLKNIDPRELGGVQTILHFVSTEKNKNVRSFVLRQKQTFGENPEVTYATDSHYGLVKLLAAGIQNAGSLNKEAIIDSMENITFSTATRNVYVRKDHHMNLRIYLAEFSGGSLVIKKDFGIIVPEDQQKVQERVNAAEH